MSIPSISEAGRVPSSTSGRSPGMTSSALARQAGSSKATASPSSEDTAPAQPTPPRFPWLSRLSLQLESAAKQKSAFAPLPILGDNIDKSA